MNKMQTLEHMKDPVRILLIDDDEDDYLQTRDVIEDIEGKTYELQWVNSFEEGRLWIKKQEHDVGLVDYRLGPAIGLDLIREAVQDGCDFPLILLTGLKDEKIDADAEAAGAADYLIKGMVNPEMLDRAIRYSIAQANVLRQIKEMNAELENRVRKRTEQLASMNEDLQRSKLQLTQALAKERELNELKSRFVTTASHEFRTPLATILSSVSLIGRYLTEEEAPKREKHIERIKSAVTNLTTILNDFLSLAKLEEGRILPQPEWIEPAILINKIVEEMRSIAKVGQQISVKLPENPPQIFVDPTLFRNVCINLISNSIKYSSSGQQIDIKYSPDHDLVQIAFRDYGIGIAKEEQLHIFQRFFRAGNAANIQGTGLGLNITRKYVHLMQGEISFTSTLNEGTTFIVKLPVKANDGLSHSNISF